MQQPPNANPDWLYETTVRGLLMLTPLSLPFQPGPDMIQATAMAWTSVLQRHGMDDPQRDTPRIIRAFQALMDTCHQWPAPRALIENLPPLSRPYFHRLPEPEKTPEEADAEAQRRRAIIAKARDELAARMRGEA